MRSTKLDDDGDRAPDVMQLLPGLSGAAGGKRARVDAMTSAWVDAVASLVTVAPTELSSVAAAWLPNPVLALPDVGGAGQGQGNLRNLVAPLDVSVAVAETIFGDTYYPLDVFQASAPPPTSASTPPVSSASAGSESSEALGGFGVPDTQLAYSAEFYETALPGTCVPVWRLARL